MELTNFPHAVGTSLTTAILVFGVSTNDQTLALMKIQSSRSSQASSNHSLSYDRYTLINDGYYTEEKRNIETIHEFSSNLLENIEDIPLEFSKAVDDNFWDLI